MVVERVRTKHEETFFKRVKSKQLTEPIIGLPQNLNTQRSVEYGSLSGNFAIFCFVGFNQNLFAVFNGFGFAVSFSSKISNYDVLPQ